MLCRCHSLLDVAEHVYCHHQDCLSVLKRLQGSGTDRSTAAGTKRKDVDEPLGSRKQRRDDNRDDRRAFDKDQDGDDISSSEADGVSREITHAKRRTTHTALEWA